MELPIWTIIAGPLATIIVTAIAVKRFISDKEGAAVRKATDEATSEATLRLSIETLKFEQMSIKARLQQLENENQRAREETKADFQSFKNEFMKTVEKLDFKIDNLTKMLIEEISNQTNKSK